MMGVDVDISKDTVQNIVIENVKKGKFRLCFVPHALTAEQEEDKVAACQNFIEMAHNNPKFKRNITSKVSCCLADYPVMKQQQSAWVGENISWPQTL
jgi:uncharacterized membrane protein